MRDGAYSLIVSSGFHSSDKTHKKVLRKFWSGREMLNLALGFVVSFLVIFFIVRSSGLHGALSMDHDLRGIQKNQASGSPARRP
jgi:hypothetical protein